MGALPDSQAILARIRQSAVELVEADPAKIVLEASWEECGLDRFDVFGIVRDLERAYDIEVPSDDLYEMETVGDLVAFVGKACK
jgi:acyl carrier protein